MQYRKFFTTQQYYSDVPPKSVRYGILLVILIPISIKLDPAGNIRNVHAAALQTAVLSEVACGLVAAPA